MLMQPPIRFYTCIWYQCQLRVYIPYSRFFLRVSQNLRKWWKFIWVSHILQFGNILIEINTGYNFLQCKSDPPPRKLDHHENNQIYGSRDDNKCLIKNISNQFLSTNDASGLFCNQIKIEWVKYSHTRCYMYSMLSIKKILPAYKIWYIVSGCNRR